MPKMGKGPERQGNFNFQHLSFLDKKVLKDYSDAEIEFYESESAKANREHLQYSLGLKHYLTIKTAHKADEAIKNKV